MSQLKKLLFIAIVFGITGCSSVTRLEYDLPLLHFEIPETVGKPLSGSFQVQYGDSAQYNFGALDINLPDDQAVKTSESISKSSSSGMRANIGIIQNVDIYLRGLSNSIDTVGIKTQLIGTPGKQAERGFKLSISGEMGDVNYVQNSNSSIDRQDSSRIKINSFGASLIIGYRMNQYFLWYTNIYAMNNNVTGMLVRDNITLLERKRINKIYGSLFGVNIKLRKSNGLNLTLETGINQTDWKGVGSSTVFPVGVAAGFHW